MLHNMLSPVTVGAQDATVKVEYDDGLVLFFEQACEKPSYWEISV